MLKERVVINMARSEINSERSPLGDMEGQLRISKGPTCTEGFVWEKGCYRLATKRELQAVQPVSLEELRSRLPRTITKYYWARKMGPQ